jgi:copper(I)-binding protein
MKLKKPALIITTIVFCGAVLAACSSDDSSGDSVAVNDVWTRTTAPTATTGAVYMDLESADGDRLVSASVPADVAGRTEIHEVVDGESMDGESMDGESMDGESSEMPEAMMGMRELEDGLEIPAGEEVSLEPGGYHIMLLELEEPIAEGDTIPVTLMFENAGEVQVEAEARDAES